MSDRWNWICTAVGDAVFGVALSLPRDHAIILMGVGLAILLIVIRILTTDRVLLRQIAADEHRLRELVCMARHANDHAKIARCRRVRQLVAMRRARLELPALLISFLVLAAAMSWGHRRLNYLPPKTGEPLQLVARFPGAIAGEVVHLVPVTDASVDPGWVQVVPAHVEQGEIRGVAIWSIRFTKPQPLTTLVLRYGNQTATHHLSIGTTFYEPPVQKHESSTTELVLTEYRPLGVIPFHLWPGIPGWSILLTAATASVYLITLRIPWPTLRVTRLAPSGRVEL
jgi:hypothetical protein